MLRKLLAFSCSGLMAAYPGLAQSLPPDSPFAGMQPSRPRLSLPLDSTAQPREFSDEQLGQYVAQNGRYNDQTTNPATWKIAIAAAQELNKRAQNGNAKAAYYLGREAEFPSPHGTQPDYGKAEKWYYFAAQRGNLGAGYRFGEMCWYGTGRPKDEALGTSWKNWALTHGFNPGSVVNPPSYQMLSASHSDQTSAVASKNSDTDAMLLGAAALLFLGAMTSGNSSESQAANSTKSDEDKDTRTCLIDDDAYSVIAPDGRSARTMYRSKNHSGADCDSFGAYSIAGHKGTQ